MFGVSMEFRFDCTFSLKEGFYKEGLADKLNLTIQLISLNILNIFIKFKPSSH